MLRAWHIAVQLTRPGFGFTNELLSVIQLLVRAVPHVIEAGEALAHN
jgi:hypothetical protein